MEHTANRAGGGQAALSWSRLSFCGSSYRCWSGWDCALESIAPRGGEYQHHLRWHDDNGSSHVRAALMGPSVTVPFEGGTLLLGTWQQIVLVELDTRGRQRDVVFQVIGE